MGYTTNNASITTQQSCHALCLILGAEIKSDKKVAKENKKQHHDLQCGFTSTVFSVNLTLSTYGAPRVLANDGIVCIQLTHKLEVQA